MKSLKNAVILSILATSPVMANNAEILLPQLYSAHTIENQINRMAPADDSTNPSTFKTRTYAFDVDHQEKTPGNSKANGFVLHSWF